MSAVSVSLNPVLREACDDTRFARRLAQDDLHHLTQENRDLRTRNESLSDHLHQQLLQLQQQLREASRLQSHLDMVEMMQSFMGLGHSRAWVIPTAAGSMPTGLRVMPPCCFLPCPASLAPTVLPRPASLAPTALPPLTIPTLTVLPHPTMLASTHLCIAVVHPLCTRLLSRMLSTTTGVPRPLRDLTHPPQLSRALPFCLRVLQRPMHGTRCHTCLSSLRSASSHSRPDILLP